MYGFVIPTYFDSEEACKMFDSLVKSIPVNTSFQIAVVDGGSSEEHIKRIQSNIGAISATHQDLSSALNLGHYHLLGSPSGNIKYLVENNAIQCSHIFCIHPDMKFLDFNWAEKLIFCYDYVYPLIGKMAAGTRNIDNSSPDSPLRGGNSYPTLFGSEVLVKLINKHGYIYCPDYPKCSGHEDWHNNRQLLDLGYGFGICSLTDVHHRGMGSRSMRDTNAEQILGSDIYFNHFNTYNEPGFEIDMTDIGNELKKVFEKEFPERWYNK